MSTSEEQIKELASTTSHNEQLILLKKYSQNGRYFYAYEAVVKALEMNNIDTAKIMAVFYRLKRERNDLLDDDLSVVVSKAQTTFSWPSFVDFFLSDRKGIWGYLLTVDTLAKALISKDLIRLSEFVRRPIHTFYAMLYSFKEPEQLSETIYKIMTEKGLTRSDRLNMLKLMRESNKLTLEPCGPKKLSPPFYCLSLGKLYLLRQFKNLPGMAQQRGPNGENFFVFAWKYHPYLKHIRLFDKDELKIMIVEKYNDSNMYVLDLLQRFQGSHVTAAFVSAFKELMEEGKMKDCDEVNSLALFGTLGAKLMYQYGQMVGSDPKCQLAVKCHRSITEKFQKENCVGNTTFTFDELPIEIFQLICEELDSRTVMALLSTSNSLYKFATRFDMPYYERMMKKEYPMIYGSLKTDQSQTNVNWIHQLSVHSRREYSWHTCKNPSEIRIEAASILKFDENWLLMNPMYFCGTLLWNVKEQKFYKRRHGYLSKHNVALLNSPEVELPTLVSMSVSTATVINYNSDKPELHAFKRDWNTWYVSPVSPTRFITGDLPEIFDIELNETVVKCSKLSNVHQASYNKLNQMTALSFTEALHEGTKRSGLCVLDKNFEITHMFLHEKSAYATSITWLDEFTFMMNTFGSKYKSDIRMPRGYVHETNTAVDYKPLSFELIDHISQRTGEFTSNYALQVSSDSKLACIRNMKDLTWSNVIVLPDDVKDGQVFCNSRYAAVETTDNSVCLLDFLSNK